MPEASDPQAVGAMAEVPRIQVLGAPVGDGIEPEVPEFSGDLRRLEERPDGFAGRGEALEHLIE